MSLELTVSVLTFEMWRNYLFILVLIFLSSTTCISNKTGSDNMNTQNESNNMTLTMLWCGEKNVKSPSTIYTDKISVGITNIPVNLIPAAAMCSLGVNETIVTMDTRSPFLKNHTTKFSYKGDFIVRGQKYSPKEFCITEWTESKLSVKLCGTGTFISNSNLTNIQLERPQCGSNNSCLPKCCEANHLLTITANEGHSCSKSNDNFTFNFNPVVYSSITRKSQSRNPINFFKSPTDRCNGNGTFYMNEKFCFHVQEDGSLFYRDHSYSWVKISLENYCVDAVQLDETDRTVAVDVLSDSQMYGFVTCQPIYEYAYLGGVISTIFGTGFTVGSMFLLLTFLVYAVLWKEQNIQGWIAMSHSATMFFWYFFLGISILLDPEVPNRSQRSRICLTCGIVQHFFALSNFCWLAINSFSLFWIFRNINAPNPQAKHIGQYMMYVALGWGVPFVFVMVSVILDSIYSYDPCNMFVVPDYGFEICFISPSALGPYLYYPVTVVMSLNFIFFSLTAYKLCGYKRRSTINRKNLKTKTELFQLIAKLFLLTGCTWILDFATWIHSRFASGSTTSIPWYSGIVNFISVFQVVPICIIYLSRPSVLSSLKTKHPRLEPILSVSGIFAKCSWLASGSGTGNISNEGLETTSKDEEKSNAERLRLNVS